MYFFYFKSRVSILYSQNCTIYKYILNNNNNNNIHMLSFMSEGWTKWTFGNIMYFLFKKRCSVNIFTKYCLNIYVQCFFLNLYVKIINNNSHSQYNNIFKNMLYIIFLNILLHNTILLLLLWFFYWKTWTLKAGVYNESLCEQWVLMQMNHWIN